MLNFNVYCFLKQYPARLAYRITKSQSCYLEEQGTDFWDIPTLLKAAETSWKNLKRQPRAEKSLPGLGLFSSQHKWHAEAQLEKATWNKDNEIDRGQRMPIPSMGGFCIKMLPSFIKSMIF